MKALLAVDSSTHALRATRTFVDLAKDCADTRSHVLNVHPHNPYVDLLGEERRAPIERWVQERGNAAMEYACRMLSVAGLTFEVKVVSADAPLAITRIALARHCYFEMKGTRGMGATAGMALGFVAAKVVHLADLPVTLVK